MTAFARFSLPEHGTPAKVATVAKVTASSGDDSTSFRRFRNFRDSRASAEPEPSAKVSQLSRLSQAPAVATGLDADALLDAYAERMAICLADGIREADARATAEAEIGAKVMRHLL